MWIMEVSHRISSCCHYYCQAKKAHRNYPSTNEELRKWDFVLELWNKKDEGLLRPMCLATVFLYMLIGSPVLLTPSSSPSPYGLQINLFFSGMFFLLLTASFKASVYVLLSQKKGQPGPCSFLCELIDLYLFASLFTGLKGSLPC